MIRFIFISLLFLGVNIVNIYALDLEQSSISQNSANIAVFVSINPNDPNPSTVNLYHDVITNIRQFYSDRWSIIKISDATKYIDTYRNADSNILRSVLYINRKDFLASKEKKEPIKLLQYILETFAIEDSIVVDCKANGEAFVESCGLYVYNRVKKRFTIAVEKIFTSPISDISSWGKILVDRLVYNIRNMEEESTQAKLNKLLEEKHEEEPDWNTRVEVGFKISGVKSYVKNVYGLSLGVMFNETKEKIDDNEDYNKDENENENISNRFRMYYGLRGGYDIGSRGGKLKDSYLSFKYIEIPVGVKYVYKSRYIFSSELSLGYGETLSWNVNHKDEATNKDNKINPSTRTLNFNFNSKDEKLRYKKRSLIITPRVGFGYSWSGFRLDGFIEFRKFVHISSEIKKKSKDINYCFGGGIVGSWYF